MVGQLLHLLVGGILSLAVHSFIQSLAQVGHQPCQLVLLNLAQHAVEVDMVELQVDVGGHKRREALVVVLLVDMEQLFVVGGHDGKAVARQLSGQLRVKLRELPRVGQVLHVHLQSLLHLEVQLQQLLLTHLHALHEVELLGGVLQDTRLLGGPVVVVAPFFAFLLLHTAEVGPPVEVPHQRVIPRRALIDATNVGILERESLARCRCVAQHAQVAELQSGDVHVEVQTVLQRLHVDGRYRHCRLHHSLFLAARDRQSRHASHK